MSTRTITVDATDHQSATPDVAAIAVKATGEGQRASEARETARDRAATIRESVTAIGPQQIQTVQSRIERTSEMIEPTTDAAYQATERLYIECVPEIADEIITQVADSGGTIAAVKFELDDSTRHDLHDAALAAAMQRAREKARRMAAVEGLEVDAVERVTTVDVTVEIDHRTESLFGSALVDYDANMVPKPIAVAGTVKVVYALSER